jgi:hypothetical protein
VDVDRFFQAGAVSLCKAELAGVACNRIRRAIDLANGNTHLRLSVGVRPPGAPADPRRPQIDDEPTRIPAAVERGAEAARDRRPRRVSEFNGGYYFHAVDRPERKRLYLDYWWYLPYNPNPVGEGLLCGPGFAVRGVSCHQHDSDWEGVTVELDTSGSEPEPIAVHYAQHGPVVRYEWTYLQRVWAKEGYRKEWREAESSNERPLVFVASGSHASYPDACDGPCFSTVAHTPEGGHDGDKEWSLNSDSECEFRCLKPLPLRNRGRDPALWNAFQGPWGEQHCIMDGLFCDVGSAPRAPSQQDRYETPWSWDMSIPGRHRPG